MFELTLAALGARLGGLSGLSLGWVAAICVEAALMARPVYQALMASAAPTRTQAVEKSVPV